MFSFYVLFLIKSDRRLTSLWEELSIDVFERFFVHDSRWTLLQQKHIAVKRVQIPVIKEPANLILQNGKRPDGSTLFPWSRGQPMEWDVTVPDT